MTESYIPPPPPQNRGDSPPFSSLISSLFDPLSKNLSTLSIASKRKPHEVRLQIIEQYITKWRKNVGNDIYPAFRLKRFGKANVREQTLLGLCLYRYGLKEKAFGRLIVKLLKLGKDSPDAKSLLNWKQGQYKSAGNFAERCYEVMKRRETKNEYGNMSIIEVNNLLDKLSVAPGSTEQLDVLQTFYTSMNSDEFKWLIKIILRYTRLGATERTFFSVWHPDANALFNVSSSLKRVCWELYNPEVRLQQDHQTISLMSCFRPQLAAFKKKSYQAVIKIMDGPFYIEEKMDGERIQIHLDDYGKTFKFFSRKAKDYTYLYGSSFDDTNSSLTKHLKSVISPRVRNCILDGEMVAWDPEDNVVVPFGSLKTAALNEGRDSGLTRPMYAAFDLLYLNDSPLVDYSLETRKKALDTIITPNPGYFVLLPFQTATAETEITERLREVIEQSSEGLVIKNPRSVYSISDRNDNWIKIKPEYMEEYGENLDLCVVGAFYGNGARGNKMATYLCGLRAEIDPDMPDRFWSFCKAGGGFTANDFATIKHVTNGKWNKWDPKNPPDFIELGFDAGPKQIPDLWIHPKDSLVFEVKGAQVVASSQFRVGQTLRFPRFKQIREDKTWESALSYPEFMELQSKVSHEGEKKLEIEKSRRQFTSPRKKRYTLLDYAALASDDQTIDEHEQFSGIFTGHTFYILTDSVSPKMNRVDLQNLVKRYGGAVGQQLLQSTLFHAIGDKIAGIIKEGKTDILRPNWILDCIETGGIVDVEPKHVYYGTASMKEICKYTVDSYGDPYFRHIDIKELNEIFGKMTPSTRSHTGQENEIIDEIMTSGEILKGLLFFGSVIYFDTLALASTNGLTDKPFDKVYNAEDQDLLFYQKYAHFGGAQVTDDVHDPRLTLIISAEKSRLFKLRSLVALRPVAVRIVHYSWIERSWAEGARLPEESKWSSG